MFGCHAASLQSPAAIAVDGAVVIIDEDESSCELPTVDGPLARLNGQLISLSMDSAL